MERPQNFSPKRLNASTSNQFLNSTSSMNIQSSKLNSVKSLASHNQADLKRNYEVANQINSSNGLSDIGSA
jgi:hypothetical protein